MFPGPEDLTKKNKYNNPKIPNVLKNVIGADTAS